MDQPRIESLEVRAPVVDAVLVGDRVQQALQAVEGERSVACADHDLGVVGAVVEQLSPFT
jgi:hypothetical protein